MDGPRCPVSSSDLYWSRRRAEAPSAASSNAEDGHASSSKASKGPEGPATPPIVVLFGWMKCEQKHVKRYTDFYTNECGWDALAVHPATSNLWFPGRALRLALRVLDTLLVAIQDGARPIVLASFSGGAKACLYKLWQVLLDECPEAGPKVCQRYQPLRSCIAGQIYDSSPIDHLSEIGVRFLSHTPGGQRSTARSVAATMAASLLDGLFKRRFEEERRDFWQTLEKAAVLHPLLLLYSRDDPLACAERIDVFVADVRQAGADVTAVTWAQSPHVGHMRTHSGDYKSAVKRFLLRAQNRWLTESGAAISRSSSNTNGTDSTYLESEESIKNSQDHIPGRTIVHHTTGREAIGRADQSQRPRSRL